MNFLYPKESFIIRGIAFDIYKNLGNSHKEKIYHNAYIQGLIGRNLLVEREKRINIFYNERVVGVYVPDLIVNGIIIMELKAKLNLTSEDIKQFRHYLKNSDYSGRTPDISSILLAIN